MPIITKVLSIISFSVTGPRSFRIRMSRRSDLLELETANGKSYFICEMNVFIHNLSKVPPCQFLTGFSKHFLKLTRKDEAKKIQLKPDSIISGLETWNKNHVITRSLIGSQYQGTFLTLNSEDLAK